MKVVSVAPDNRLGERDFVLNTIYLYDIEDRKDDRFYLNAYRKAADKVQVRNEIIHEWIAITDEHFYDQQISQRSAKLMGKGAGIGLSIGSTIAGGDTAKVLSGLSALVQSGNDFIDREVLQSNTLSAIGLELEQSRKKVYGEIEKKLNAPVSEYPLSAAQQDILRYWRAGSPVFALHGLVERAAIASRKAEDAVKTAKGEPVEPAP